MTQTMSYVLRISTVEFDTEDHDMWRELAANNPAFDPETPSQDPEDWLTLLKDDPMQFEFHDCDVSEDEIDVEFEVEDVDE